MPVDKKFQKLKIDDIFHSCVTLYSHCILKKEKKHSFPFCFVLIVYYCGYRLMFECWCSCVLLSLQG